MELELSSTECHEMQVSINLNLLQYSTIHLYIYIYCIYNIHVYVYTSIAFYCIHLLISIDPERRSSIKAAMREFPNTPFESFKKHLSSLHLRCKTLLRVT